MIYYFYWVPEDELHGYGAFTEIDGRVYRVFGERTPQLAAIALAGEVIR